MTVTMNRVNSRPPHTEEGLQLSFQKPQNFKRDKRNISRSNSNSSY